MKIIFLGTSGSMPTQNRGASAIAIKRKRDIILFDCGEGTQQRMVSTRIGFRRPTKIFISHLHGDHILGLPGLIQTMTMLRRERPLYIYGPQGLFDYIRSFNTILGTPSFPLKISEIQGKGTVFTFYEYRVEAVRADHDGECWAYALTENPRPGRFYPDKARALSVPEGPLWKRLQHGEDVVLDDGRLIKSIEVVDPLKRGRKIVYSGDTRPVQEVVELSNKADVLIHEATFDDKLMNKAAEDGHSTAREAAEVAAAAKVRQLILTHISSRYPDPNILLEQAKPIFSNTIIAEDLMEVYLPF